MPNPLVNQNSIITWPAVPGAERYEITAQDSVGTNILNGGVPVDLGNVLSAPVSSWLAGQPVANGYQLFVRAVRDSAPAEVGPYGQLNVDLVASLVAPVPTVQ